MTAHTVVLAQTRVSFLTGGGKKSFLDLDKMNKLFKWKHMCNSLSPGLGHCSSSWVFFPALPNEHGA